MCIILNEKAYAEDVLEKMELGKKPVETLGLLAKYYHGEGYKKQAIAELLESFLLKCDPSTNIVKWQDVIGRLSRSSGKYGLIDIPAICITKAEVEQIQKIDGKLLQRLLFTMVCLAKYGNAVSATNNNWVNKDDREIFSLADIKLSAKKQSLMINDLYKMGCVGYSRIVDNVNINVKIINDDSPVVLEIRDFRNLGNQYRRYCGEKFIECTCCGKVVRENSGKQKYCKECAMEVNRQKASKRYYKT